MFLEGTWRLLDVTRAAGEPGQAKLSLKLCYIALLGDFDTSTGQWKQRMSEHFFLTDPEELIYTHFPFLEGDPQFDK